MPELTTLDRLDDVAANFTAQPGSKAAVTCSTPLELIRHVTYISEMNASLKFEAIKAIDFLREYLVIREAKGLEYIFATALYSSCLSPVQGSEAMYDILLRKFRELDRRRHEVPVAAKSLPITAREPQFRRFILCETNRVNLIRCFHIAQAMDADGPWSQSVEKEEMMAMLIRLLTGYRAQSPAN
jgi:hypothetical protein